MNRMINTDIPDGIDGVDAVITDRKRAESELQTAVRQWNTTFDAMNDGISIMDEKGTILQCNKAMLRFLNAGPQDIVNRRCWEVVHHADACIPDCPFQKMKISRQRETSTVRRGPRWVEITVDPIIDQKGNLTGGVHIMTDVTERRNFETQLRESESKFRILAEQSLVGTYIIQDGMFKYVSPRLADMFAYKVEDIIDRMGPLDLVVPEDHHMVDENMKRRLSGEIAFSHYEARGRTRTGEILHIEIFGSVMSYQDRPAIIGVVLDITEKKKLEDQLRQAQKMEAVGQLTGGIAHDFNNILSAIIGYGNLLQMKLPAGNPLRPYVDQILAGSDRAANLTRSLLTFSRKQISDPQPVNINDCIGRVEKLLRRIISEDIDFRTVLAPTGLIVNADAGQIEQILINLATNARDAMPDGGSLTIATGIAPCGLPGEPGQEAGDRHALLTVTDTGVGMDEKTREKIFEPFFTTKDLGRGTGLGLSMVYGIIKQHGGRILCSSEPGKGTTFSICLPLLALTDEKKRPASPAGPEASKRRRETILVAEDDEALRKLAAATLQTFGYTVIEAVDGEDAVEKFRAHKDTVRLVLCDVIMPRKNGGEVDREIRRLAPQARIVFMSGYPADFIRQKYLVDEGAEIVLKPVSPTELLKRVSEALQ